jgi:hypothetical protein
MERLSANPPAYGVRFSSEHQKPLYLDGIHPNVGLDDDEDPSHGFAEFTHGIPPVSHCVISLWAKTDKESLQERKRHHPGWEHYHGETTVLSFNSLVTYNDDDDDNDESRNNSHHLPVRKENDKQDTTKAITSSSSSKKISPCALRITYTPRTDQWHLYVGHEKLVSASDPQQIGTTPEENHGERWMHVLFVVQPHKVGIHRDGDKDGNYSQSSSSSSASQFIVLGDYVPLHSPSLSAKRRTERNIVDHHNAVSLAHNGLKLARSNTTTEYDEDKQEKTVPSFAGHFSFARLQDTGSQIKQNMPPFPGSIGGVKIFAGKKTAQTVDAIENMKVSPTIEWEFVTSILPAENPSNTISLKEPQSWTHLMERERALLQGKNPRKELASPPSQLMQDPSKNQDTQVGDNPCQNNNSSTCFSPSLGAGHDCADSATLTHDPEKYRKYAQHKKEKYGDNPAKLAIDSKAPCIEDTSTEALRELDAERINPEHEERLRKASPQTFSDTETAFKDNRPCPDNVHSRGNDWSPHNLEAERRHHFLMSQPNMERSTGPQASRHEADITRTPKLRTRLQTPSACLHPNVRQYVQSYQETRMDGMEGKLLQNVKKNDVIKRCNPSFNGGGGSGDGGSGEDKDDKENGGNGGGGGGGSNDLCTESTTAADIDRFIKKKHEKYQKMRQKAHTVSLQTRNVEDGTPKTDVPPHSSEWTLNPLMERVHFYPNNERRTLGETSALGAFRDWFAMRVIALQKKAFRPRDVLHMHPADKYTDDIVRRILRRAVQSDQLRQSHPRMIKRISQLVDLEDNHYKHQGSPPKKYSSNPSCSSIPTLDDLDMSEDVMKMNNGNDDDDIHGLFGSSRFSKSQSSKSNKKQKNQNDKGEMKEENHTNGNGNKDCDQSQIPKGAILVPIVTIIIVATILLYSIFRGNKKKPSAAHDHGDSINTNKPVFLQSKKST